jgi:hypothetical protein
MKLPVLYQSEMQNKMSKEKSYGFLVMEALIALALMTMIVPSAMLLSLSNGKLIFSGQSKIVSLAGATDVIENGAINQIASSSLLYQHEFGKTTCSLAPQDTGKGFVSADIYSAGGVGMSLNFGTGAVGTNLVAHNGFVYETTVPASKTLPDFFVIDDQNFSAPKIISSLVTGPGLAAVAVSGYYAYVANESTVSQLKVIDIHDRTHPVMIAQLRLPLPNSSTTAPAASSIFYDNGLIYLGTQKWSGNEMNIINVSNPSAPSYLNGFETDSLVNSVYENGGYAYLAMPSTNVQMDVLDVRNPLSISDLSHVAPSGSAVLEGKVFSYDSGASFETENATGTLYFARSGGGFNNTSQYEIFSYNLAHDPYAQNPLYFHDIPGGVYGAVFAGGYVFLATGDINAGFQIWKSDFSKEVYFATLPSNPISLSCDHNRLYAAFSNPAGFALIIPH